MIIKLCLKIILTLQKNIMMRVLVHHNIQECLAKQMKNVLFHHSAVLKENVQQGVFAIMAKNKLKIIVILTLNAFQDVVIIINVDTLNFAHLVVKPTLIVNGNAVQWVIALLLILAQVEKLMEITVKLMENVRAVFVKQINAQLNSLI